MRAILLRSTLLWYIPMSLTGAFTLGPLPLDSLRRGPRLLLPLSSVPPTSTMLAASATTTSPPLASFTTLPMPLYIEDTDAYGVKYNANYLRTFDRALHQAQVQSDTAFPSDFSTSDWSIVAVEEMKLKQAPNLGQEYVVHGRLRWATTDSLVWDMSMTSPDGATVFATARGLTIQDMLLEHASLAGTEPLAPSANNLSTVSHKDVFNTFRDEFDAHLPNHLPLYAVLKLFERTRSNWIGGPDALHRMQNEDKVVYVVTAFHDLSLLPHDNAVTWTPGNCFVSVQTDFTAKRSGMVVECRQTASLQDVTLAQARVTIMALDSDTWRPTKRLPEWFLQKLQAAELPEGAGSA